MARPITCESLDGNPAAYMITDLFDGTTFAVCVEHWVDLCGNVAASRRPDADTGAEAVEVEAAEADDADPGTVSELAAAVAADLGVDVSTVAVTHLPGDGPTPEPAQRARTRRKLAERPDSTATSEAAVPWPRVGEDPHS
jgi:hypothetical protein